MDWKKAVSETALCGKTHGDTIKCHSDVELLKQQFRENELPKVEAIEVYHDGRLVFGYEFFYQGGVQVGHHIGSHIHPDVRV